MKSYTGSVACLIGLLAAGAVSAQDQAPAISDDLRQRAVELRDGAAAENRAFEWVESLTTEVGSRLAGSPGDKAAVAWALLKMRELRFDNVRAEPVTVPHWERGDLSVRILEPFPQPLVAISLGGSVGTGAEGVEAPVVMAEDLEALKAMPPEDVEGKIAYVGDRMARARDGSGYGKAVTKRVNGPVEAARLGARALVIRSVGTSRARIPHTGTTRYRDDVKKIPAVAVSNADADMIERQLATGREVIARVYSTARRLADAESANVIGEIPGSDPDAGIVVLAAHLDSWDVGTGAVDDGAGVAIALEAARLIGAMDERPRRTIRVILYANEEFGLSGARAYANKYADELDEHVLAMEADFGAGRVWRLDSNVAESALPLVAAIQDLVAPLDVEAGNNDSFGGADIGPLRERGVPVLGPRQDGTEYFDVHHTISDTLDKVRPSALRQNVAVYATAALVAASVDDDFGRLPVDDEEGDDEEGDAEEGED